MQRTKNVGTPYLLTATVTNQTFVPRGGGSDGVLLQPISSDIRFNTDGSTAVSASPAFILKADLIRLVDLRDGQTLTYACAAGTVSIVVQEVRVWDE